MKKKKGQPADRRREAAEGIPVDDDDEAESRPDKDARY